MIRSLIALSVMLSMSFAQAQDTQGGQQGMPSQGNQQGMPPKGKGPMWTPERCEKEIKRVTKMADNCLKIKKEDKRRGCFDRMSSKFPPGFEDACRAQIEPVKAIYQAKEKEMYPNQGTSMSGHDNGGTEGKQPPPMTGTQGGTKTMKPEECEKMASKIRKEADSCLKIKDAAKRKMCFDKIGEEIQKVGFEQACGDMANSLKSEYQSKEAQMYPGQPASIQ